MKVSLTAFARERYCYAARATFWALPRISSSLKSNLGEVSIVSNALMLVLLSALFLTFTVNFVQSSGSCGDGYRDYHDPVRVVLCVWLLVCHQFSFLADRTIGRAFGTVSRLSVCLSVTFCIVAKRCVLAKKCLKE